MLGVYAALDTNKDGTLIGLGFCLVELIYFAITSIPTLLSHLYSLKDAKGAITPLVVLIMLLICLKSAL